MSYNINIQKRLIFAGIVFGVFSGLVLYTGQENLLNTFSQVWIIPDWFLWGLAVAFSLAFIDVIMVVILFGIILILGGWFVFFGAYLVPLPVLYQIFIPQTNSIQLKLLVYSVYAFILIMLLAPLIIHWYYRREQGSGRVFSTYFFVVFACIVGVIAVSLGVHYPAYFMSYFTRIYERIYEYRIWFIPVSIGIVWLVYFLITGDILIYEQIDTLKHHRKWKETAYQTGWREAEEYFHKKENDAYYRGHADGSQEARINNGREGEKKLTNVVKGADLDIEEVGRLLNLWQQKYTNAEGNKKKMKEANERLLFYTDLFKELKNRKEVIK